jgi:hypothetical protein
LNLLPKPASFQGELNHEQDKWCCRSVFRFYSLHRWNSTSAGFTLPCCMFCSMYLFFQGP